MHRDDRELDDILRALAAVVRSRREQLGISQEELAYRAGLHRTYISDIERGSRNIAVKNLVRLAHALGVPVSYLFTADAFQERSIDSPGDPRESRK
jgi:transcriptional regulator with XRE-family HTH domain